MSIVIVSFIHIKCRTIRKITNTRTVTESKKRKKYSTVTHDKQENNFNCKVPKDRILDSILTSGGGCDRQISRACICAWGIGNCRAPGNRKHVNSGGTGSSADDGNGSLDTGTCRSLLGGTGT